MKYDDASWHYEGDFPQDLPPEAGATHIGQFLAWMLLNGFASEELLQDAPEEVQALKDRAMTGAQFLIDVLDEKLTDQEFTDEGNRFAVAYYNGLDDDSKYVDDYFKAFGVNAESLYNVPDTWANYDKLADAISARFAAWLSSGRPEYIV